MRGRPYPLLVLAVACVSLGSILIRWAGAPAPAVAFYRIFFAAAAVAPFAARDAVRTLPHLGRAHLLALVGAGLSLALHFATWIASLSHTTVAASVLLVNTAPVFTIVFSAIFLRERTEARVLVAIAVALAGAALIAVGDWSGEAQSLRGVLLALAGAVTLSLYHVAGRGLRAALPLGPYLLAVWSVAALALAGFAAAAGVPFGGYPPRTVLLFLALALVPTVAGHGLVNRSLRHFPAPTVGLFLLGEPLFASLLAYAAFGEAPGGWTVAGGALVLLALVAVVGDRRT